MYCYRDNKKYKSDLVVLADTYLKETLLKMNDGIVIGCRFGIEEILKGIGFDIDKCLLMDIPNCLVHQDTLTHYTVEECYKRDYGVEGCYKKGYTVIDYYKECSKRCDFYRHIVSHHYGKFKNLKENYVGEGKFSSLGALEIEFIDMEYIDSYTLLIDMYSGYALLSDGESIKVYGINRHLLNYDIAFKYREMGIEAIPNVFLMAVYGKNSYDYDELIDEEWEIYNSNFETDFKKLGKEKFSRVFKENVERYK